MQESLYNYDSKSQYFSTALGENYKIKLNRTTLFILLLVLRAIPKCYSKDQEKNAKKNTVYKQVVGGCKGHVYQSCYEVPNYSEIVCSCDRIWLRVYILLPHCYCWQLPRLLPGKSSPKLLCAVCAAA